MPRPLKAYEVATLEKVIGRRLRSHEIQKGKLDTADASPFDQDIADAAQRLEEKRLLGLSQEERDLEVAKQSRQKHLEKQADAKALVAHQQKVAPRIAELKKLQAATVNDPAYSAFDKTAIEKAISYLEFGTTEPSLNDYQRPSVGDSQIADALYAQVTTIVAERNAAKKDTLTAKRLDLEKQRIALEAELSALEPQTKPAQSDWTKGADVAARDRYMEIRKQNGGDENHADVAAARSEWYAIADKRPAELQTETFLD